VSATAITATSATITWTTDQAASSRVSYGTTPAYGSQSALSSALVTSHSVTLTGLTPGTTYNYAATSANSGGTSATSGNFTFATTSSSSAAPVITAVAAWPVDTTTATILWSTDQLATSVVNYGLTTAYGSQVTLNGTLALYHLVPLAGLTPGTTYHYSVTSANASGVISTSVDFTFKTAGVAPPPPAAPAITAVTATGITPTTATITWTTNQPATSLVTYGTTTAYGSQTTLNTALATSHSMTITGLTPGTTYNYAAVSANAGGSSTTSANFTFATTSAPAPLISAVTATAITTTSATITWTTDIPSTTRVAYGTTAALGTQSPLDSALVTSHSMTLIGLTPGTTYFYAATSVNGSGGSATSANFTFTTPVPTPVAPVLTAMAAWPVGMTTATIVWTSDQPATSLVKYGTTAAYGSTSALNSSLGLYHLVPLTGLTPGTTYHYAVVSTNASGVIATSTDFSFTTTGTVPPPAPAPVITALTATAITSTSATITWTTDVASTTQVSYGVTPAYGTQSPLNTALVTSHSVTLAGLTPGTSYNYAATSSIASGASTTSANFTFTTSAPAGTGDFSLAVVKGYEAVKEGNSGTFKLSITPAGGFSGQVNLGTPSVSPAGIACNAIGQVAVTAGVPVDVTITCPTAVGSAPGEIWTPELGYTYLPYNVSVTATAAGVAQPKSIGPLKLTVRPWTNPDPAITAPSWTETNNAGYQVFTVTSPWTYSGTTAAVGSVEVLFQDPAAAGGPLSLANACRINMNHLGTGYLGNNAGVFNFGAPSAFGQGIAVSNSQCDVNVPAATFTKDAAAKTITWTLPIRFQWTSRQVHAYLLAVNDNYRSAGYRDGGVLTIGGDAGPVTPPPPTPNFTIATVKGYEAVREGAPATFTLRLTAGGGFSGAVDLGTPSVSPASGVTCNPLGQVTLTSAAPVNVTITCATAVGSAPAETWTPEFGYTYAPYTIGVTATANGFAPKSADALKLTVRPWQNPNPQVTAPSWSVANGADYQVFTVTSPWTFNGANPVVGNIEILVQDQAASGGSLSIANACRIDLNHLGTGYLANNGGQYNTAAPLSFGSGVGALTASNGQCALNVVGASFTKDAAAQTITWKLPIKFLGTDKQFHLYSRPSNENYRSGGYRDAGVIAIGTQP
jgi:hypothetical protein